MNSRQDVTSFFSGRGRDRNINCQIEALFFPVHGGLAQFWSIDWHKLGNHFSPNKPLCSTLPVDKMQDRAVCLTENHLKCVAPSISEHCYDVLEGVWDALRVRPSHAVANGEIENLNRHVPPCL